MPYDDVKLNYQNNTSAPKRVFKKYDIAGWSKFNKSLGKLPYGHRIKIKGFMRSKFAGGAKLSHSRILKEVRREFGVGAESKVKEALTVVKHGLTETQKERNIKYARRQRIKEEDNLAADLKKGRMGKIDREARARQRIDDKINELIGEKPKMKSESELLEKGGSITGVAGAGKAGGDSPAPPSKDLFENKN